MRLFGDGKHGQAERIQTFRGPACRTTFSARRDTPLYRLKTPSQHIGMVLSARACGLDPSEALRVFGYRQATITSLSDSRLSRTLRPYTNAPSAISGSRISSWTNCARGCAAPNMCCGCGWPSILSTISHGSTHQDSNDQSPMPDMSMLSNQLTSST